MGTYIMFTGDLIICKLLDFGEWLEIVFEQVDCLVNVYE